MSPSLTKKRGSGRPTGSESTRSAILREAREAFGRDGFDGVSLRSVAVKAKVDPSTVIHFFGTKEGLFEAVARGFAPMLNPLVEAMARRSPGVELAKLYLQMWEEKENGATMRALIRTSFGSERAYRLFRAVIVEEVLRSLRSTDPIGAELAMTHLIGIGLGRHIMRLPQLSSAAVDVVAEKIGPTLDSYLGT